MGPIFAKGFSEAVVLARLEEFRDAPVLKHVVVVVGEEERSWLVWCRRMTCRLERESMKNLSHGWP